jgi:hypothetical protein
MAATIHISEKLVILGEALISERTWHWALGAALLSDESRM